MSVRYRVGVLRGGKSDEYDVSLASGAQVLAHIDKTKFEPVDILIDKKGVWYMQGVPVKPEKVFSTVDVVFNALHGGDGENGHIQRLMEQFGMPYNGSKQMASKVGMNKSATRESIKDIDGLRVPRYKVVAYDTPDFETEAINLWKTFPHPLIVKPVTGGSSRNVVYVDNFPTFVSALAQIVFSGRDAMIEEYIDGEEITVPIVEDFRNEDLYVPASVHISKDGEIINVEDRTNGTLMRPMQNFNEETRKKVESLARTLHTELGLRHYAEFDFILSPRGVYFLEVNTLPALTEQSTLPFALDAAGITRAQFLTHILEKTLRER